MHYSVFCTDYCECGNDSIVTARGIYCYYNNDDIIQLILYTNITPIMVFITLAVRRIYVRSDVTYTEDIDTVCISIHI